LWLVEGVLAGLQGDDASATLAFAAARRTEAAVWDDAFGADLAALWAAAEPGDPTGLVELLPEVQAPWVVHVDGQVAELPAALPAGLHAVQVHHDGVVRFGQMLRVIEGDTVRISHTLPASPKGLAAPGVPLPAPRQRVSFVAAVGISSAFGSSLDGGPLGKESAAKLLTPVEVGLQAEGADLWVRGALSAGPSLTGPFLYARDAEAAKSPVAVGGHVAAGPVIGTTRLGVLAAAQWPGRIPLRAVVALPLGDLPIRFEGRAGVNFATERTPEPGFDALITYVPWL
jgi:hypothetical protein